ncbi:transposase [Mesorhizobium sp. ArgA1]
MRGQAGFWDIDERYVRLSEAGDPLEKLNAVVPWEVFRKPLGKALRVLSDWGRFGQDAPALFSGPFRGSLASLRGRRLGRRMIGSGERGVSICFTTLPRLGRQVRNSQRDRLAHRPQGTIRASPFRAKALFARFDKHLGKAGYLPMGGQIVDATIVAPKQRNTLDGEVLESQGRRRGKGAATRHRHSRLRLQRTMPRPIAGTASSAAGTSRARRPMTAQLRNVLNRANTGSTVWADTAYRSKKNEEWLEKNGYVSDIHQKKPKGRPMSEATSGANGRRSKTRAFVEHVFAQQKSRMGLVVRTTGIARARTKIGMANLAYNLTRFVWHEGRTASA